MLPVITATELKQLSPSQYILIDARGMGDSYGRYKEGHLEGAHFVDLDKDLSIQPADAANGGRHPLPRVEDFAATLGRLGITPQTHVIVYDDKAGANSAGRFWWMLKAIGHERVQVLSGGLQAAAEAGMTLTQLIPAAAQPQNYPVISNYQGTATLEDVQQATQHKTGIVIDVREAPRYLGKTEPLDLIAGHIPGAINVPYAGNMDASNQYLLPQQLKAQYEQVLDNADTTNVIVHCGSGVTACHTLLALEQAGLKGAKLYVGSWSEWSRRNLPIATDEV